ncbi:MAG: hypothetical protein JNN00_07445 [Chitinophagaceae bacterium]|nr:hypothetical protein [Chitinophagaceae bacterium]
MEKNFKLVPQIIGSLIAIALIASYPIGLVHSFKKHSTKDFVISIVLFPWGIFRGIEMFWHENKNEVAVVNWGKRLKTDVYVLYRLMTATPNVSEENEMTEAFEKFSEKIQSYPIEKINYLKEAAKRYSRFLESASADMEQYFTRLSTGNDTTHSGIWSIHSSPIRDSIITLYDIEEFKTACNEMDSSMRLLAIKIRMEGLTDDQIRVFQNDFHRLSQSDRDRIDRTYKAIFNEKISL